MRRYIERNVEDLIANELIDRYPERLLGIHLDVQDGKITIKAI